MEAVLLHSSQNQPISPNKSHVRNPKRMMMNNNHSSISRPVENFFPSNNIHTGLLQTPNLFLSHSFPPFSQLPQPPPLLFPATTYNNFSTNLSQARGMSSHPIDRKPNHYYNRRSSSLRDSSLTPKKPKSSANSPKKEEKSKRVTRVVPTKIAAAAAKSSPDPKDLPMDVSKVVSSLSSSSSSSSSSLSSSSTRSSSSSDGGDISVFNSSSVKDQAIEGDSFSGSVVFTLSSPPPSSLPLPTFSLRPKLSCNAEAAAAAGGIDAGATDNLRRLLRLR